VLRPDMQALLSSPAPSQPRLAATVRDLVPHCLSSIPVRLALGDDPLAVEPLSRESFRPTSLVEYIRTLTTTVFIVHLKHVGSAWAGVSSQARTRMRWPEPVTRKEHDGNERATAGPIPGGYEAPSAFCHSGVAITSSDLMHPLKNDRHEALVDVFRPERLTTGEQNRPGSDPEGLGVMKRQHAIHGCCTFGCGAHSCGR
jgi:hypothetical protein